MATIEAPLTEAFYYILLALRKPNHGYGIIQEVAELTDGRVQLGAGTLYGALQTLQKRAWIEIYSEDEASRKKKEYIITPIGRKAFEKEREGFFPQSFGRLHGEITLIQKFLRRFFQKAARSPYGAFLFA